MREMDSAANGGVELGSAESADAAAFHATVCAWLEADGWVLRPEESGPLAGGAACPFPWLATAYKDGVSLIVAAPAPTPDCLVLSYHFKLELAERAQIDRLPAEERAQLVWDLLSHLNLLQVEYLVDGPVPHEVLLTVSVVREGLTRDLLQRRVARLSAALRTASLAFAKALGTLLQQPASQTVH